MPSYRRDERGNLIIEGLKEYDRTTGEGEIIFKNFSMSRGQYDVNYPQFNIIIPEELANELRAEGYNVKMRAPQEEGDEAFYHILVNINFNSQFRPNVYIIKNGRKKVLDEETIKTLDDLYITFGEVLVNMYHSSPEKTTGWVNVLGVEVENRRDPFDYKYAEEEFPEDDLEGLPFH